MSLKEFLTDAPGKLLVAITALGAAVTAAVAILTTGPVAAAVGGVWAAAVVVWNVIRNKPEPPPVT